MVSLLLTFGFTGYIEFVMVSLFALPKPNYLFILIIFQFLETNYGWAIHSVHHNFEEINLTAALRLPVLQPLYNGVRVEQVNYFYDHFIWYFI